MKPEFLKALPKRIGGLVVANLAVAAVFVPVFAAMVLADVLAGIASDGYSVYGHPEWSVFGDNLAVLVLFLAALSFRSRWCAALAAVTACVDLALKIFALVLYRETFMSTDFRNLKLLWEHTDAFAVRAALGPNWALWLVPAVLFGLAAVAGLGFLAWRKLRDIGRRARAVWMIFAAVLLAAAVVNIGLYLHAETRGASEVYTGHLVRPLPVAAVYFARDAFSGGGRSTAVPLGPKSREVLEAMEVVPRPGAKPAPGPARFDRIIIIALESLDLGFVRAVNPAKIPEGATPNLDRLFAEYPAMTNYFCSAQPTSWGLTGILLSRLDFDRDRAAAGRLPSLFTVAAKLGYRTCYFSPMTGVFADNRRVYGELFRPEGQCFLEEWKCKYGLRRSFSWGISDRELYDCVLRELRSWKEKRFVVLVSTMDTHPPYTADGLADAEAKLFSTPFLRALHSTDRHLGEFLKALAAEPGLYDDRTLVVVTADHSATHGENYTGRKDFSPDRIPLVFVTPARELFRNLDFSKYASSIDLAPTLVELIGGEAPASFMGRSLFCPKNVAISWLINDALLVRSPAGEALIPLDRKGADPEKQALVDFFHSFY